MDTKYAVSGRFHTICLSDNGTVHAFGKNDTGQLGLGHYNNVSFPTAIPILPKIQLVSCGFGFTICVDTQGSIWSFGTNEFGQLGIGNTITSNTPQKIKNIPPVESISCGGFHTLVITNDSDLWSFGKNNKNQLLLGHDKNQNKPEKTKYSNIYKIASGYVHSLFQNTKGEIYGCGYNSNGELGIGNFTNQTEPKIVLHQPENIIQFCSGYNHTLFLDNKGNVYAVGQNKYGSLGLGHNANQNILHKIPNIPPIQIISCIGNASFLLDTFGKIWSFGSNGDCGLGHGDNVSRVIPMQIASLDNIQQISSGVCGVHFLAKDKQNNIFVTGRNSEGQIALENIDHASTPRKINSIYFDIWKNQNQNQMEEIKNQWKFISDNLLQWNKNDTNKLLNIQLKIKQVKSNLKLNNNVKMKQEFPQNSFENWHEVQIFLNEKSKQINLKINENQKNHNEITQDDDDTKILEDELLDIDKKIHQLQQRKIEIEEILIAKDKKIQQELDQKNEDQMIRNNQKMLKQMCNDVSIFCENENQLNDEIENLFSEKSFDNFDCFDLSKILWKMDLIKYQQIFQDHQIDGEFTKIADDWMVWHDMGIKKRDCFLILYYFQMMRSPGYFRSFSSDYDDDCFVCSHNTPEKTIHLLNEYEIPIDPDIILHNDYCSPILTFTMISKDILGVDFLSEKGKSILLQLEVWKQAHKNHLISLNNCT